VNGLIARLERLHPTSEKQGGLSNLLARGLGGDPPRGLAEMREMATHFQRLVRTADGARVRGLVWVSIFRLFVEVAHWVARIDPNRVSRASDQIALSIQQTVDGSQLDRSWWDPCREVLAIASRVRLLSSQSPLKASIDCAYRAQSELRCFELLQSDRTLDRTDRHVIQVKLVFLGGAAANLARLTASTVGASELPGGATRWLVSTHEKIMDQVYDVLNNLHRSDYSGLVFRVGSLSLDSTVSVLGMPSAPAHLKDRAFRQAIYWLSFFDRTWGGAEAGWSRDVAGTTLLHGQLTKLERLAPRVRNRPEFGRLEERLSGRSGQGRNGSSPR
ncbi:MAG: hypothetical protein HY815_31000, partial [Candidatus Riflebacteria bacterium]|nr:hypothetical protein [Candidatus Riflebacteria bacterium]